MSLSNHCQPFQTVHKQALEMNSYTGKYSILLKHTAESRNTAILNERKQKASKQAKSLKKVQ